VEMTLYHYRAKVTAVYDGDTCTLDIDLGLGIIARGEKVRLYRINAPEIRGPERPQSLVARDFLRGKIKNKTVLVQTVKGKARDMKGKYGRYLADIWLEEDGSWVNINDLLVQQGHAEYKEY